MKTKILCLVLALVCIFALSCTKAKNDISDKNGNTEKAQYEDEVSESSCPYALMHDGVMYYYTGEEIFEDVEYTEEDILGRVTSTIPENRMPTENGMANIPIEGSIYIKYQASDDLLVLIDKEWIIFETRD